MAHSAVALQIMLKFANGSAPLTRTVLGPRAEITTTQLPKQRIVAISSVFMPYLIALLLKKSNSTDYLIWPRKIENESRAMGAPRSAKVAA